MGLYIDLHVHTKRHSTCSAIAPDRLVKQAVNAGLSGLVITEHQYQWSEPELDELRNMSGAPGLLVLAGFEYTSKRGDILIYGLEKPDADAFPPGLAPDEALELAAGLGGVCVAAHPTRAGMGFDEAIFSLPFNAIEVASVNLKPHEQRLAKNIANKARKPAIAASDAHRLDQVGRYATEFTVPVQSMADLQEALVHGRFHLAGNTAGRIVVP